MPLLYFVIDGCLRRASYLAAKSYSLSLSAPKYYSRSFHDVAAIRLPLPHQLGRHANRTLTAPHCRPAREEAPQWSLSNKRAVAHRDNADERRRRQRRRHTAAGGLLPHPAGNCSRAVTTAAAAAAAAAGEACVPPPGLACLAACLGCRCGALASRGQRPRLRRWEHHRSC